jgi:hypothetical protein
MTRQRAVAVSAAFMPAAIGFSRAVELKQGQVTNPFEECSEEPTEDLRRSPVAAKSPLDAMSPLQPTPKQNSVDIRMGDW